jgi:hypothetical protein
MGIWQVQEQSENDMDKKIKMPEEPELVANKR